MQQKTDVHPKILCDILHAACHPIHSCPLNVDKGQRDRCLIALSCFHGKAEEKAELVGIGGLVIIVLLLFLHLCIGFGERVALMAHQGHKRNVQPLLCSFPLDFCIVFPTMTTTIFLFLPCGSTLGAGDSSGIW